MDHGHSRPSQTASVERRVYPDVRHELHHDPVDGARIVDEMTDWLRERLLG